MKSDIGAEPSYGERASSSGVQDADERQTSRDHVKELNNVRPKQPFFFLKPPTSLLQPGAGPVIAPKGVNLHYEIELALIMGKEVKDLDASDEKGAFDAIESEIPPYLRLSWCSHSRSAHTCLISPLILTTPRQATPLPST